MNSCELEPEDILSDNLYHYDSKEKVFELAENFKERIATKEREPDKEAEKESAVGKLKKTQDKVKEAPKKEHKPKSKDKGEMAI